MKIENKIQISILYIGSTILLFLFYFVLTPSLEAQSGSLGISEQSVNRSINWSGGENALHFEVVIEKLENGQYSSYLIETTTSHYLVTSFQIGEYRFKIIPYDILGRPAEGTEWYNIVINSNQGQERIDISIGGVQIHSVDTQNIVFFDDPFQVKGLRWNYNNEPVRNFYNNEMRQVFLEYEDSNRHYTSARWKNTTSWVLIGFGVAGLVAMYAGMSDAIEGNDAGLFYGGAGAAILFSLTSLPFTFSSSFSLNRAIESYNNNARNQARQQIR